MSETPDRFVVALAAERAGYLRSGSASRVISVDEQLANRGWCVNAEGDLVKVDKDTRRQTAKEQAAPERADAKAPEDTVEPKPRRRS